MLQSSSAYRRVLDQLFVYPWELRVMVTAEEAQEPTHTNVPANRKKHTVQEFLVEFVCSTGGSTVGHFG